MIVMTHSIASSWRLKRQRYNLIGTRCTNCKSVYFPPRPLCPDCRRRGELEEFQLSGHGEILSYTIIRVPPEGFEVYTPYAVGLIQLEEGTNISGQITGDISKIDIGKKVRPVFRKLHEDKSDGLIHYGIKFELVE